MVDSSIIIYLNDHSANGRKNDDCFSLNYYMWNDDIVNWINYSYNESNFFKLNGILYVKFYTYTRILGPIGPVALKVSFAHHDIHHVSSLPPSVHKTWNIPLNIHGTLDIPPSVLGHGTFPRESMGYGKFPQVSIGQGFFPSVHGTWDIPLKCPGTWAILQRVEKS